MVVKTEPCVYSEFRIYPGRGKKFVAKDGRTFYFINAKCAALFHQKIKAVKLTWTTAWRRFHKKIAIDEISKKRTKKTTRVQKAIVGLSLDEIKRRRAEKPEERDRKMEAAKKEVKDRQKKKQVEKKKEKVAAAKAAPKKVDAKSQPAAKGGKGGKKK